MPVEPPTLAANPRFKPTYPTSPWPVIKAAKLRAEAALRETNPKLTTLERAFYEKFKANRIVGIRRVDKGRYVVSTGASKKVDRTGRADANRLAA